MDDSTQVEDRTFSARPGEARRGSLQGTGAAARLKFFLSRTFFWRYERGTWQYDLICLVILAFIFLTPRSWFQDRPTLQLTDLRHNQGVVDVGRDRDGHRYIIDARLVESLGAMKLEDAVSEILRRRLQKAPKVKSIDPIQDRNKVVLGYTVVLAP